jgi:MFS family permease
VTDTVPSGAPADASRRRGLLTRDFVLLTISGFFAMCGFASTLPLVPRYVEGELGGGKVAVGVAVGVFSVSAVFARPLVGRLGDERGRRFIIVGGTALTAVTVAGHALATTLPLLYLVRLAMGATQGAFFVGSATLVNDLAPPERRGEATNYFSVSVYGGMAIGPLLGEVVQRSAGFDVAFVAGGAALLAASGLATLLARDRPGAVASTGAAGGPDSVGSGAAGRGPTLGGDADGDRGRARPAADPVAVAPRSPGLLHRAAIVPGFILMGGLVTFTALNGFMPLYVEEEGLGSAGSVLLVYGLLVLVMRMLGSRLPDQFGTLRTSAVALVGQAAGMLVMGLWASQFGLYVGAAVLAVGGSFLYPTLLTAAVHEVPDNERARATSTFTLAFELSAGLGGPLLGVAAALTDTRAAFFGAALSAVAALPLLWWWAVHRPDALVPPRSRQLARQRADTQS